MDREQFFQPPEFVSGKPNERERFLRPMEWASAGTPVRRGGEVRRAYCKTAAPPAAVIDAYLDRDAAPGVTPGPEITVHCDIDNGTSLADAFPTLRDGTPIWVRYYDNKWYCDTLFTSNEDC